MSNLELVEKFKSDACDLPEIFLGGDDIVKADLLKGILWNFTLKGEIIQSVQYKKIYYLSIQVQDFQTCNSVYLTFNNQPTAANITLTSYNGIYTFNSPENGSIDLTGLFVYCDTGTAIVSISGVAY